ncbi:MAG TPA: hypothetical protein VJZ26_08240 [Blastocatellia bacterium]|nr:hypothetical protein [Blastocatellia bacterium]
MEIPFFNRKKASNHIVWKLLGGAALAVVATGLVVSLPDIKRYIKISTM